jgi:hypothetical protein
MFFCIFHIFPNLITIQPTFLPYFPYLFHNSIYFSSIFSHFIHIFQIFSLFNLFFFHNFHIF